jgi:branched-subunit amino acid transport protein
MRYHHASVFQASLSPVSRYFSRPDFVSGIRDMIPPLMVLALRYVPAAMLTAIVLPAVAFSAPGILDLGGGNPKLIAALVASAVAWRWRSVTATMAAGMIALWVAQWALRAAANRIGYHRRFHPSLSRRACVLKAPTPTLPRLT